jgi:hypothetical protein
MTRKEDILMFLERDRIWPPGTYARGDDFVKAIAECLSRLSDDVFDRVEDDVWFIVDIGAQAMSVPFQPGKQPPRANIIVIFDKARKLTHAGKVGLVAHEIAHGFIKDMEHTASEDAADSLAESWGFGAELKAVHEPK